MIIRILGDGQYEVPGTALDRLNELDADLQDALDAGDGALFDSALGQLIDEVHWLGAPVPDSRLVSSDLVLPGAGSRLEEVAALVGDDGLIPG